MSEVRARAARHKGQLNFENDSTQSPFPTPQPLLTSPSPRLPLRLRRHPIPPPRNHARPRRASNRLHHRNLPRRRAQRDLLQPAEDKSRRFQVCD